MHERVLRQVVPLRRMPVRPSDPRDVHQADRARRLHCTCLGPLDEPEPLDEPAAAIGQEVADMLPAGTLREQDIAGVEAAIQHQVDHGEYCIDI